MTQLRAADELDRLVPQFDALVRDARLVTRQAQYDELEARAARLSDAIRGAFRNPSPRPVAAPIEVLGPGKMLF